MTNELTQYVPTINFELLWHSVPFVLSGLPYTIGITFIAFVLGNIIGLLLTLGQLCSFNPLRWIIRVYISFMRGVPTLVVLFILYFGLPTQLSALYASILCFTMTSSAFISEIYRGALLAVGQGQWDAATALGLPFFKTMRKIILPQAIPIAIPSLSNLAMDLLKGTSLAAMITVPDIFQKAKIIGGREFDYMTMYLLIAIIYWLLCLAIGQLQKLLESRYGNYLMR